MSPPARVKPNMKPIVVIEVEGGCVQSVYINGPSRHWPHVFVNDLDQQAVDPGYCPQEQVPESLATASDGLRESVEDQLAVHRPPGRDASPRRPRPIRNRKS